MAKPDFDLRTGSLDQISRYAKTLDPFPAVASMAGTYEAEFIGPAWVRASAPLSLALTGFKGWWGKHFDDKGNGVNILRQGATFKRGIPMVVVLRKSRQDGKMGAVITYPADSRFPWARVADEARPIDKDTLLGITFFGLPGLSKIPFPFLIRRTAKPDGI